MMRTALRAFTLAAAVFGTSAAGYNHTKAPKAAAAGARVKQAQLCIDNFSTAGTDPSGNAVGTFSFNGKLYMCESWDGSAYTTYLGEVAWSCMWAPTSAAADQLVPCQGTVTTMSARKIADKQPLSTATVNFWVAEKYLDADVASAELVAPTVTSTSGSWPKPHAFNDFGWSVDSNTSQLYLNIEYKSSGFNPAAAAHTK